MIGLYCRWNDGAIDPGAVRRFTGSLGAGLNRPVGHQVDGGVLFATLCTTPVEARSWHVARTPAGERVLFTGYFDHQEALARELGRPVGDAAALYAAGYARWGDAVDLRMLGQFATIIVAPGEGWVRCARSPIFAPPLHVWRDSDRVVVASVARVLFATGEATAEVDEQKIADSLYLNYAEGSRGWYKGVTRIATGSHTVITRDGLSARPYYDVAAVPRIRLRHDDDYVAAANTLLAEGTRSALAAFRKPAVSLSGGLDSQAVAACAMEARGAGQPLRGLTGVPEPEWRDDDNERSFGDERRHVAALAEMYPDLTTETVDAAGLSFDHLLPAMFLMAGGPPRNTMNLYWIHALRARAKARGCDVLLLGQMGNHGISFSGAGALPSWLARGHWVRLLREVRAAQGDRSFARTFVSQALMPLLPDPLFRQVMRLPPRARSGQMADWCPLQEAYADAMHVEERARALGHDASFRALRSTRAYRRAAFGNAMREGGDIRQALDLLHGIPTRDPTAYRPLIEFCLGLPDEQFLRDGTSRWLARRMLQGRVPEMVVTETRRGRQAADWPLRLARQRQALIIELDLLADDPAMAARLDLPRLKKALEEWPQDSAGQRSSNMAIQLAIPRAIATARFIRFVEGTNRS